MKFPRYPEYKDSGIEWLGEVPEHWDVLPLKRDVAFLTSGSRGWAEHYSDDGALFIRIGNLTRDSIRLDLTDLQRVEVPEGAEGERTRVRAGDILFSITAYLGSVAVAPEGLETAYVSQHVALARLARRRFIPDWVAFVVLSHVGKNYLGTQGYGGTKVQLSLDDVANLVLTAPPLPEQRMIADFLHREVNKIDALVAEQETLIVLLNEKRQAAISNAVTKGMNPAAPLKGSGIEWLGKVPEHWRVCPLKRDLEFLTSGSRGWAEHYADDGALFIRIGNLTRDSIKIDLSDIQRVDVPEGAEGARTKTQPGDVLFSITAYLGSVAVVPDGMEPAYVSQHVCLARLRQNMMLPEWVAYVTLSRVGKTYLESQGYGGTKIQLALDDIGNLTMTVPPLEEQAAIVSFLDEELLRLAALGAEAERAIELLKEHRAALISAAVTGKIDVRGLVEPVGEVCHEHALSA